MSIHCIYFLSCGHEKRQIQQSTSSGVKLGARTKLWTCATPLKALMGVWRGELQRVPSMSSCLSGISKWALPELNRTCCHQGIHLEVRMDTL